MANLLTRSEILARAWADYRRDAKNGWGPKRGGPFDRKHFAYCLRMVWAIVKERAAKAAAPKPAPVATVCVNPVRAAQISTELHNMALSNFIDWNRHSELRAELASLQVTPSYAIAAE